MNKFIEILENNKENYFFGGEKNLTPFISGEFTEKFKETILEGDTHCKYNFNKNGYSEFKIELCKNPNRIKFIDIQINKKGNKYDKVRCMFENSLDIQKVKKIFIGHTESKLIEKEEFYNMIKQAEIELDDMVSENEEEDKETIKEFIDDYGSEIYDNYIVSLNKYNNDNKNRIYIEHRLETEFFFDLYGKLEQIWITEDSGYVVYMTIKFKDTIKEVVENQESKQTSEEEQEKKLASEKDINDLINLFK